MLDKRCAAAYNINAENKEGMASASLTRRQRVVRGQQERTGHVPENVFLRADAVHPRFL